MNGAKIFQDVFNAELAAIAARHKRQTGTDILASDVPKDAPRAALGLTGISCSGGGIRSAAFCLGVLQGLQSKNVIDRMDYLSTVSGGGYIGATFSIGMAKGPDADAAKQRSSHKEAAFPFGRLDQDCESLEVKHLRDNSRYLLQDGIKGLIPAAAIYLRGLVMNTITVLPILILAAAFLVALHPTTQDLVGNRIAGFGLGDSVAPVTVFGLLVVVALLVFYAVAVSVLSIQPIKVRQSGAVFAAIVLGLFLFLCFLEMHGILLRLVFVSANKIMLHPAAAAGDKSGVAIFDFVYKTAQAFVTFVSPLVVAMLPFWKTLATKASQEVSGFQEGAKRIASRLALLIAAAVVPVLLWLVMVQLAYWGTAISVCTGAILTTDCNATYDWSHAPPLFQTLVGEVRTPLARLAAWSGPYAAPLVYILVALLFFAIWPFLSVNSNSLHQLYRDRLGRAFLIRRHIISLDDPEDPHPIIDGIVRADDFLLSELAPDRGPYHILNTALNVPGSRFANRRGRNADFFIFSQRYIGSEATGYVETRAAEKVVDGLNLGTAVAISGAAAAPNMGLASIRPLSATIALLNVRLGRWVRHPLAIHELDRRLAEQPAETQAAPEKAEAKVEEEKKVVADEKDKKPEEDGKAEEDKKAEAKKAEEERAKQKEKAKKRQPNGFFARGFPRPQYLLYEAFFKSGREVVAPRRPRKDEKATTSDDKQQDAAKRDAAAKMGHVFLSDGGHIENLGIYELLRRRCKLIIAIDGEADERIDCPSLIQLERLARIDHNIAIRLKWRPIGEINRAVSASCPPEAKSGPHVALGLIDYPAPSQGEPREQGALIYIKASLSGDENDYVLSYKAGHPDFPHETTADQLFSEEQFEAYRALGEHIAVGLVSGRDPVSVQSDTALELVQMVKDVLKIEVRSKWT